jgi:hypothetical protein
VKRKQHKVTSTPGIHTRLGTLFLPYLNGDVASYQEAEIEAHIRECPSCREQLVSMYELKLHWRPPDRA